MSEPVGLAEPKALRFIGAKPSAGEYTRVGLLFLIVYPLLNVGTSYHMFPGTQITFWSPDNAFTLLLLLESTLYAPIVYLASLIVDFFISDLQGGMLRSSIFELLLLACYVALSIVLRDVFGYDYRRATFVNVVRLFSVVPVASAGVAGLSCLSLYLTGGFNRTETQLLFETFWTGDTVGIIVLLPAATACYDLARRRSWSSPQAARKALSVAAVAAVSTGLIALTVGLPDSPFMFSLLYLPTLWVGINGGFNAVALTLLATQLMLIVAMSYFGINDLRFGAFQMQMLILAATGQLLGAAISERDEAERDLRRQHNDLSRLTSQATTGALAVAFAHEISQPLSSLSSYLHAAKRMMASRPDLAEAAAALAKAEESARRTRVIITRIREFVASGALDLVETDLRDIGERIVNLNHDDARQRGLDLRFRPPERPLRAKVDRIAVEQALNNLVINALESSRPNAPSPTEVEVKLGADGAAVAIFEVLDDGPGVAPDLAERLFEPFETNKLHGMGLGLTLAAEVARKHGGELSWRPREPHGASFRLQLPLTSPHPADD